MFNFRIKTTIALAAALAAIAVIVVSGPAHTQAAVMRGMLFHDGGTVRTLVPPAALPHGGRDPLYMVQNGVSGQLGITSVAPGDANYHGGAWAIYLVTWNAGVTPYLLTSDEAVAAVEGAGDVTVTRAPNLDNRCPVQP